MLAVQYACVWYKIYCQIVRHNETKMRSKLKILSEVCLDVQQVSGVSKCHSSCHPHCPAPGNLPCQQICVEKPHSGKTKSQSPTKTPCNHVWVNAFSFFHCVASPFHSFVTTQVVHRNMTAHQTRADIACIPASRSGPQPEDTTLYICSCKMPMSLG